MNLRALVSVAILSCIGFPTEGSAQTQSTRMLRFLACAPLSAPVEYVPNPREPEQRIAIRSPTDTFSPQYEFRGDALVLYRASGPRAGAGPATEGGSRRGQAGNTEAAGAARPVGQVDLTGLGANVAVFLYEAGPNQVFAFGMNQIPPRPGSLAVYNLSALPIAGKLIDSQFELKPGTASEQMVTSFSTPISLAVVAWSRNNWRNVYEGSVQVPERGGATLVIYPASLDEDAKLRARYLPYGPPPARPGNAPPGQRRPQPAAPAGR